LRRGVAGEGKGREGHGARVRQGTVWRGAAVLQRWAAGRAMERVGLSAAYLLVRNASAAGARRRGVGRGRAIPVVLHELRRVGQGRQVRNEDQRAGRQLQALHLAVLCGQFKVDMALRLVDSLKKDCRRAVQRRS
jgi:hypothetical protein